MNKIIHGGNIYIDSSINWIDFSANINPLGITENIKKTYIECINDNINYPDPLCTELRNAISKYENINFKNIICGNGAADIIYRICYALKPKSALIAAPTFSEYESALLNIECNIKYYKTSIENDFDINLDILNHIKNIDIIFLCNPNNPTGRIINKELLYYIAEKAYKNNIYLVIDECFNDFIINGEKYSAKNFIYDFNNIIILKAFTKIYAIPGMRLGYALLADCNLYDYIYFSGPPWNVSVTAQRCGITALKEISYLNDTKKIISEERIFLNENLKKLGFIVFESVTNFIFFKSIYKIDLCQSLKKYNILIRSCENYKNLDNSYYRIAVKLRKDNLKLIIAMKEILK